MRFAKTFAIAAGLGLGVGLSAPAAANLITAVGPNAAFTVLASCANTTGCNGQTPNSTVSAEADFSNFVWSNGNTSLTFTLKLSNTTQQGSLSTALWDSVRLTAFGFNTLPDATGVTDTSTVFNTVTEDTFPGFNKVDVCESSQNQNNNCAGGSNGGLYAIGTGINPMTDTFTMTFTGLNGSIDLGTDTGAGAETFDFKIQSDFGSFEFAGTPTLPGGSGGEGQVPEPASLVLLGTALAGLGLLGRRRRKSL